MDLRVRARVHGRRQLAARGLGRLFDQLRDDLYELDPLQLGNSGLSKDEYGSPVATIIPRLKDCVTAEQVEFVIDEEMRKHYPTADLAHFNWSKLSAEWLKKWRDTQAAF